MTGSPRYDGARVSYRAVPITVTEAEAYVGAIHRHNGKPSFVRIAVGAVDESGTLRGVATAGRPVAPGLARPTTLEVSRVCSDGAPNLCSFLYARIVRAARELGYARLVTYTKEEEDGASLKAAGWQKVPTEQRNRERKVSVRDWQAERGESRTETVSPGLRDRWEIRLAEPVKWTWPLGLLPEANLSLFGFDEVTAS